MSNNGRIGLSQLTGVPVKSKRRLINGNKSMSCGHIEGMRSTEDLKIADEKYVGQEEFSKTSNLCLGMERES